MTLPNQSTKQSETPAATARRPATSRIILAASVVIIVAFLAGFLPMHIRGLRLTSELRAATQENHLAELRDLAGLLYLQASQKDYGLAAGTSTRFFERTRVVASQIPDPSGRKPLMDLLSLRDQITSELAKGEPAVVNDLQAMFVRTREATIVSTGTPQTE